MKKNIALTFIIILLVGLVSCNKTFQKPTPPATIDKNLLIGWWAPVSGNYVKANIYFGSDNFFYTDTVNYKTAPIAGFWALNNNAVSYSATLNGTVSATYNITKLTADSLEFNTSGLSNQRFHKLNLPAITSTAISTIAGGTTPGFSGDGGLATTAQISNAEGITVDAQGNIYFCDEGNYLVRKISTDGKISTIAGTGSINAPFKNGIQATMEDIMPSFLTIDAAGSIYISESMRHRIDKISAADGTITCIAGSIFGVPGFSGDGGPATSATLLYPNGLAIDAAGDLYIADGENYRIRKVSATNGLISTIAGNGVFAYLGDGGLAINASLSVLDISLDAAGNIYFSDFGHNCVRKIDVKNNIISTIAGTGVKGNSGYGGLAINARLNEPFGLKVAPDGDIFINDIDNYLVLKVDGITGVITKIAGTGYNGYNGDGLHATAYSFSGPFCIALDLSGNIYVTDVYSRIRKIAAN